ncbi:MAG TPA: SpoIIE family protein phosphatase, partial [Oligoflexia bacterium]|nr:SpoIIE family protein phosphatase [Oligoflexia bacterium]
MFLINFDDKGSVRRFWSLSIRAKIILLVTLTLTVSLCSYLYIGTTLIIGDKVSYIYDYNLSQSRISTQSFDSWISKIVSNTRMMGAFLRSDGQYDREFGETLFQRFDKSIGVESALFFRAQDSAFVSYAAFGQEQTVLEGYLVAMGWTPSQFNETEMLLGTNPDGKLLIASHGVDLTGAGVYLLAVAKPDAALLKGVGSKDTSIFLYDSAGKRLTSSGSDQALGASGELSEKAMTSIVKELLASTFPSGVREWVGPKKNDYILSYERLGKSKFTVVASIPKATAFAAAHALVQRSFALGVSILLVSIGLAMLFVKGLTRRIRELWNATRQVSEGDFSVRVQTESNTADEINSLGQSFNTMADKIHELMAQTAEKARMEKELETAQVVQSRFFPVQHFEHMNLTLAGRVVPASECGGDWWFYAPIGNRLLVVIGDVTGHGVSSALVTAAVHGGFTMLIQKFMRDQAKVSIKEVIETLNAVVFAAAKQEATMTFVASLVDLDSGEMEFVNA